MVHKKYIKRDGKTFGPYLYQNYREKGVTKTRYLGLAKERKNLRVNLLLVLGIILLFFLLIGSIGLFVISDKEELKGELASESPFDFLTKLFTTASPVNVFVQVIGNNAPEILNVDDEIFVCENKELLHLFNITDIDGVKNWERDLSVAITLEDRSIPNPFYVNFNEINFSSILGEYKIWSGILNKSDVNKKRVEDKGWAVYPETIAVTDWEASDSKSTNIILIEVNNPPNIEPIGAKTLWTRWPKNRLYYQANASDIETAKENLSFNLSFLNGAVPIFDINRTTGIINFIANSSHLNCTNCSKTYSLKVCVEDTGIKNPHSNISRCWPEGDLIPRKSCSNNFSLTITDGNTAPNITSYYSPNKTLSVLGTQLLYFNISYEDEQETIPDAYWYVYSDAKLIKIDRGNLFSELKDYSFGCGVSGNHTIEVAVTDGELNDSVSWNISVDYVECPKDAPSGGGGGGAGKLYCKEKWGCNEWQQCENLKQLSEKGWVSKETNLIIKERCGLFGWKEDVCGFQQRNCNDFNYCKTENEKPGVIQECYYTQNPNCTDDIRNCHDGSCEILVDCGGPCEACPTCNDNIQNQGEIKIDCGGPCKPCIELPWLPVVFKSVITYSLISLLIIILLLVARQIIKYTKFKRVFGESRIKNVLIRGEDKKIKKVVMSLFFIFFVIVLLFFANTYIMNLGQANKIIDVSSGNEIGFLANYGFINSIFSNFGMFLNLAPIFIAPENPVQGYEDILLEYDFKNNASDPDPGDNITFSIDKIDDNLNFENYTWINLTLDGNLTINSTKDSQTGNFKLSVKALDTFNQGPVVVFFFNISPVNDAPQFVGLGDKIFNEGDLFEYIINVYDEEPNPPFKFNINYVSCDALNNPSCDLFKGNYTPDEQNGVLNISFTPQNSDIGSYIINFSVMDYNVLENKTTSQIVNFTVTPALWSSFLILDYLIMEHSPFSLNLKDNIFEDYKSDVTFSYDLINSEFPSFDSSFNSATGVIDIPPNDKDVGENLVKITATSQGISSFRIFNFTILNQNDSVFIYDIKVNGVSIIDSATAYENLPVDIILFAGDDDILINQKSFYNEALSLSQNITGQNSSLFNFVLNSGFVSGNLVKYEAMFIPRETDIGNYTITVNVTDANNFSSDYGIFNLSILSNPYDTPNITYPDESKEFNLKEGDIYNLIFRANHSVGTNLEYKFYINNRLKNSSFGPGDDSNFTWQFKPNFTDETYGEKVNLTLIVINPVFNTSKIWNLTINHTNAPPQLIRDIGGPISTTWNNRIEKGLETYFIDIDHYDTYYNQTFELKSFSNTTPTNIGMIKGDSDWEIIFMPISQKYTKENLNISVCDLNGTDILNCTFSNYFEMEFTEPTSVQVPVSSGGSSEIVPISLKIIMPGQISAYEGETIKIPLKLVNSGEKDFNDIYLNSSAFKNSSLSNEIKTSLDKTYFKILKPKQEENLTLTVYLGASKTGRYEILAQASSKNPKYTDWGKIHLDLMPINESQVRDLIVFTQEFIASNPQCIEITEVLKVADSYFQAGDYLNARLKANEALNSCKESISQVSVPRLRISDFIKSFKLGSYLFLAIIGAITLAIILGLIYYFIKRREIGNIQKTIQESKQEDTKV